MSRPKSARRIKKDSVATEKRVAARYGGRRTPKSGAGHEKADGRVMGEYRIENKETSSLSYRLHVDTLDRLTAQALSAGEVPILHIQLTDRRGKKKEYVVLRFVDHAALVDSLRNQEEE